MKKHFIYILAFFHSAIAIAQNMPQSNTLPATQTAPVWPGSFTPPVNNTGDPLFNFTRTFVPLKPTTNIADPIFTGLPYYAYQKYAKVITSYSGGWGAPIQSILRGDIHDIITPYNNSPLLTHNSYMPYAINSQSRFQLGAALASENYYAGLYPNEGVWGISQNVTSYFNQIPKVASYPPGAAMVGRLNGTTTTINNNDGTENLHWYSNSGGTLSQVGTTYSANSLTAKTTMTSTYGIIVHDAQEIDYSDKSNRLLCKTIAADNSTWLTTLYLYDELGRNNYILTPGDATKTGFDPAYDYQYTYDKFSQITVKSIPAQGRQETVYDKKHRAVLYRDSAMTDSGKYQFKIYDSRDRVVMNGILKDNTNSFATWQGWLNDPSGLTITPGSMTDFLVNGFTGTYPSSIPNCEIDNIVYYDKYPLGNTYNNSSALTYMAGTLPVPYLYTQGMVTTTKTRVKDPNNTNWWVTNVFFYDQKGELIQTQTLNPWNTLKWDITTTQYSFTGQKMMEIMKYHDNATSNKDTVQIITKYQYEQTNSSRLTSVSQSLDNGVYKTIASYTYDDLGRVKTKWMGGVEAQDYDYNIRGQLLNVNNDYTQYTQAEIADKSFGENLRYEYGYTQGRFDGKLAGYSWRCGGYNEPLQSYGYDYDMARRLKSATYEQLTNPGAGTWSNTTTDYSMPAVSYDPNGNILAMQQTGMPNTGPAPAPIDIMTYTYSGNKLQSISDVATANSGQGDFQDNNVSYDPDYTYDANGNMISDKNKSIQGIVYNEQNQPTTTTFANGSYITKTYDAAGHMIMKRVKDTVNNVTNVYRYWGPMVYKNDKLQDVMHQEGRCRWLADSSLYKYDFFVKDHQGNVRTTVTADETAGGPLAYIATFEIAAENTEEAIFSNMATTRTDKPLITSVDDVKTAMLNGDNSSTRIGPTFVMKVMAGDKFDIAAQTYWETDTGARSYTTAGNMLNSLLGAFTGTNVIRGNERNVAALAGNLASSGNFTGVYEGILDSLTNYDAPRAYINYILFDSHMQMLPGQSSALQVNPVANDWQDVHTNNPVTVGQSGYMVLYLSNMQNQNVFFNQLQITTYKGRLLQSQDYYPYGLPINQIVAANTDSNQYMYQGNEKQDELGLELDDFHARQYDHQTGRFLSVDPMSDQGGQEMYTPYHFCGNDPANNTDPGGMLPPRLDPTITYGLSLANSLRGGGVGAGAMPLIDAESDYYLDPTLNNMDIQFNSMAIMLFQRSEKYDKALKAWEKYANQGYDADGAALGPPPSEDGVTNAELNATANATTLVALSNDAMVPGYSSGATAATLSELLEGLGLTIEVTTASIMAPFVAVGSVFIPTSMGTGDMPSGIQPLPPGWTGPSMDWSQYHTSTTTPYEYSNYNTPRNNNNDDNRIPGASGALGAGLVVAWKAQDFMDFLLNPTRAQQTTPEPIPNNNYLAPVLKPSTFTPAPWKAANNWPW